MQSSKLYCFQKIRATHQNPGNGTIYEVYKGGRRSIYRAARAPEPNVNQSTGHQMSWQGLYLLKNGPKYISLLLRHWYEIMALYYVNSILTEISASRQDRRVLQKKQNHQNRISEQMGHATDF